MWCAWLCGIVVQCKPAKEDATEVREVRGFGRVAVSEFVCTVRHTALAYACWRLCGFVMSMTGKGCNPCCSPTLAECDEQ